jgi:hypothetical protein
MGPYLLQQVPPLFGRERLDQVLLGGGQNALEMHNEEISQQMGVEVLGASAHVNLLEATNPLADAGFDLSLGSHGEFSLGSAQELIIANGGVSVKGCCIFCSMLYNERLSDD